MKNLIMAFFVLFSSMNLAYAAGPGVTGGGEPISQEFMSIAKSLPAVIMSKGQQLFPEIPMEDLAQFVSDGFQVELKNYLFEDGSPKAARFNKELRKVQVDPSMWKQLATLGEAAKRALVFHEILGLMGYEGNNNYTISNRLLGLETLSLFNIGASKNQIFPKDMDDNSVIFWKDSRDKQRSFYFCQDRNVVRTCKLLGNRSFSIEELTLNGNKMVTDARHDYKVTKNTLLVFIGVVFVGLGIGIFGGPAGIAYLVGFTGLFGSAFSNLAFTNVQNYSHDMILTGTILSKEMTDDIEFESLERLARKLHKTLSSIPSNKSTKSSLN